MTGISLLLLGTFFAFAPPSFSPDHIVSAYFAARPLPDLVTPITFLTRLNSPPAMILYLLILLGTLLLQHRSKREACFALLSLGGAALLGSLIKLLVHRPRPELRLLEIHSPSFPSWHSASSAALALTLWMLFVRSHPASAHRKLWGFLLALWPLFIGFSRLFLNVHWSSDVLAGWGLGIVTTLLGARITLMRKNDRRRTPLC